MTTKNACAFALVVSMAPLVWQTEPAMAQKNYGCFKVTADALNIRSRPRGSSTVITTAKAGDILEKRKLWCTPRGYWCAVRKGGFAGYADKNFMQVVPCP